MHLTSVTRRNTAEKGFYSVCPRPIYICPLKDGFVCVKLTYKERGAGREGYSEAHPGILEQGMQAAKICLYYCEIHRNAQS